MPTLTVHRTGIIQESPLTKREREILLYISHGLLQKEVADRLCISSETVKQHVKNSYRKLGAKNRIEALRKANFF
jgi:NarL family two-component system response regulator LiaR